MEDSERRKAAAAEWAHLPAELLGIISGRLGNPNETVRFRSVCRSWRSSTPLPPNKLSLLFPLKAPFFDCNPMFNASAVYLVRPRSDPSKAWLVSVNEPAAGKLILRHTLSYREMKGHVGLDLEADWIAATQTPIARFYAHNRHCVQCNGVSFTQKVVFVFEISKESGFSQLVGLSSFPDNIPFAFRLELGGGGGFPYKFVYRLGIQDFVEFKGRIFAIDAEGRIYLLDHTNLQLVQMTEKLFNEGIRWLVWARFVASDGDLYVVWMSSLEREIYRLELVVTDGNINCSGILSERVEDLGDRVFFITHNCSFSISARLLPRPWRILITDFPGMCCRCAQHGLIEYNHKVFHLRRRTFTYLSTPEGRPHPYSDLFNSPASFVVEELDE